MFQILIDFTFFSNIYPKTNTFSSVKREELKDDDILLYAQLDTMTNLAASASNCSLSPDIKMVDPLQNPLPLATEGELQDQQNKNNNTQVNMGKQAVLSKNDTFGYSTAHYVRYKLQDGKHTKVWECGICK